MNALEHSKIRLPFFWYTLYNTRKHINFDHEGDWSQFTTLRDTSGNINKIRCFFTKLCDRSFKYDANHLIRTDLTIISFIFCNSLLWSIRSKALRKSIKTILITLCISSIDLCHLCIKLTEEFQPILTHFRVSLVRFAKNYIAGRLLFIIHLKSNRGIHYHHFNRLFTHRTLQWCVCTKILGNFLNLNLLYSSKMRCLLAESPP